MSIYEMAKKYFPKLWNLDRINALLEAGKITEAEYRDIVGENAAV